MGRKHMCEHTILEKSVQGSCAGARLVNEASHLFWFWGEGQVSRAGHLGIICFLRSPSQHDWSICSGSEFILYFAHVSQTSSQTVKYLSGKARKCRYVMGYGDRQWNIPIVRVKIHGLPKQANLCIKSKVDRLVTGW